MLQVEPEALVAPKEQAQDRTCVVPASSPLPQDFSDVLDDDWSDLQVKGDWIAPTDEPESNLDFSGVFETDDHCLDATLVRSSPTYVLIYMPSCLSALLLLIAHPVFALLQGTFFSVLC